MLGIDPGLAATGYGLIESAGSVVAWGTIRTPPGPDGARLARIAERLEEILRSAPIGEASMEEMFVGRNASRAVGVAQARGIMLLLLERAGIPVYEYKPAQVKAALTGYGLADKRHIERMVRVQLGVEGTLDEHSADALAIALCHLRSRRLRRATGT